MWKCEGPGICGYVETERNLDVMGKYRDLGITGRTLTVSQLRLLPSYPANFTTTTKIESVDSYKVAVGVVIRRGVRGYMICSF